ncbi:hypothetical protein [Crocosphaera sp. XPORK-15E]|uniref:hypothetical protein n=1 Tax=Crocosphaera sp. XPORK-15E TaxID=3110247 RepID=UPI002B1FE6A7|nr:hypothetical protein [Crocosphaera sp. XPORK-15E]MEA5536172.1 hypothetical protein [Crocosphaera sp. XPORK-15E]
MNSALLETKNEQQLRQLSHKFVILETKLINLEEFHNDAHITNGYFGVLQKCVNDNNSLSVSQ